MVRMAVRAILVERQYHVRFDASYLSDDVFNRFSWVCAIEVAVLVVQDYDLAYAELARRAAQLALTDASDFRVVRAFHAVEVTSAVTARGRDDEGLYPLGRVLCQRTAHA